MITGQWLRHNRGCSTHREGNGCFFLLVKIVAPSLPIFIFEYLFICRDLFIRMYSSLPECKRQSAHVCAAYLHKRCWAYPWISTNKWILKKNKTGRKCANTLISRKETVPSSVCMEIRFKSFFCFLEKYQNFQKS